MGIHVECTSRATAKIAGGHISARANAGLAVHRPISIWITEWAIAGIAAQHHRIAHLCHIIMETDDA